MRTALVQYIQYLLVLVPVLQQNNEWKGESIQGHATESCEARFSRVSAF